MLLPRNLIKFSVLIFCTALVLSCSGESGILEGVPIDDTAGGAYPIDVEIDEGNEGGAQTEPSGNSAVDNGAGDDGGSGDSGSDDGTGDDNGSTDGGSGTDGSDDGAGDGNGGTDGGDDGAVIDGLLFDPKGFIEGPSSVLGGLDPVNKGNNFKLKNPFMLGGFHIIAPVGGGRTVIKSNIHNDKSILCPKGQGVVGISVKAGARLDQVLAIQCRSIFDLGKGKSYNYDIRVGGTGGGIHEFKATDNYVMTGFHLKADVAQDISEAQDVLSDDVTFFYGPYISEFKPIAHLVTKQAGVVSSIIQPNMGVVGKGSPTAWMPVECPQGYFLKGISAAPALGSKPKYTYVARVGAICEQLLTKDHPPLSLVDGLNRNYGYEFGPSFGVKDSDSPIGNTRNLGGPGGAYFRKDCPAGQVIMGIQGYKNQGATVSIDGFHCKPYDQLNNAQAHWVSFDNKAGGANGNKQHIVTAVAADGALINGFYSKAHRISGHQVVEVQPYEVQLGGEGEIIENSALSSIGDSGHDDMAASAGHFCPDGFALTGLKGRAGSYIDSLGGICHRVIKENRKENPFQLTGGMLSDADLTIAERYEVKAVGGSFVSNEKTVLCPEGHGVVQIDALAGKYLQYINSIACRDLLGDSDAQLKHQAVDVGAPAAANTSFKLSDSGVMTGLDLKLAPNFYQHKSGEVNDSAGGGYFMIGEFKPHGTHVHQFGIQNGHPVVFAPQKIGTAGGAGKEPLRCPKDFFVRGISAAGDPLGFVERVGLVCDRLVTTQQAALESSVNGLKKYAGLEVGPRMGMGGDYQGPYGGYGGGPFRTECPDGMVVHAIKGRAGDVVDQLNELVCRSYSSTGSDAMQEQSLTIAKAGGSGGGGIVSSSQAGYVMTGLKVKSGYFGGHWVISELVPRITGNGADTKNASHVFGKGTNGSAKHANPTTWRDVSCPATYVMTGIKGRAGNYLDSVGVICKQIEMP